MREVPPERDGGVAPVGVDVLAQGRDLEGVAVEDHGHGAVLDAGGQAFKPAARGARGDICGQSGGGEVDIAVRQAHERVAHGAADHARLLAVAVQDAEHGLRPVRPR